MNGERFITLRLVYPAGTSTSLVHVVSFTSCVGLSVAFEFLIPGDVS